MHAFCRRTIAVASRRLWRWLVLCRITAEPAAPHFPIGSDFLVTFDLTNSGFHHSPRFIHVTSSAVHQHPIVARSGHHELPLSDLPCEDYPGASYSPHRNYSYYWFSSDCLISPFSTPISCPSGQILYVSSTPSSWVPALDICLASSRNRGSELAAWRGVPRDQSPHIAHPRGC